MSEAKYTQIKIYDAIINKYSKYIKLSYTLYGYPNPNVFIYLS